MHWSQAEPILFNKKLKEHNLLSDEYKLPWYDLLIIFKDESQPVLIKENFSFGLKNIIKKLNEYNQINLKWPDLDDGLLSSFIANDIYNSDNNNKNKEMVDIVEYNYIDCLALHKIISWMRDFINQKN